MVCAFVVVKVMEKGNAPLEAAVETDGNGTPPFLCTFRVVVLVVVIHGDGGGCSW